MTPEPRPCQLPRVLLNPDPWFFSIGLQPPGSSDNWPRADRPKIGEGEADLESRAAGCRVLVLAASFREQTARQ